MSSVSTVGPLKGQVDTSVDELDRIRRRVEIRSRLKAEFNRLAYNPYRQIYRIEMLDPAVQRFMAAQVSRMDYWKPSWGSFFLWFGTHIVPMGLYAMYLKREFAERERSYRAGEVSYADRTHKAAFVPSNLWCL